MWRSRKRARSWTSAWAGRSRGNAVERLFAFDGEGRLYLVWSERGFGYLRPGDTEGDARIVEMRDGAAQKIGRGQKVRVEDGDELRIGALEGVVEVAGLRVGALIASKEIIGELNKIRLPYNINTLSQAVALVALKHWRTLDRQISLLISERRKLYNALLRTPGVTPFPTETNFFVRRRYRVVSFPWGNGSW